MKKPFKNPIFFVFFALMIVWGSVFFGNFENSNKSASAQKFLTQTSTSPDANLEEAFCLYNIPNNFFLVDHNVVHQNLPINIGNQRGTNLCWAFATNTALETSIYKKNLVSTSTKLNFSELDMAHNVFSSRSLSISTGTFALAYEYLSSGMGPVFEQEWENDTATDLSWSQDSEVAKLYKNGIKTSPAVQSGFCAMQAINFPSRSVLQKQAENDGLSVAQIEDEVNNLRNSIKLHIKNNGAVVSSIYANSATYYNHATYAYCAPKASSANHMVALVGWDDNFSFGGHTGAYIAQNSYGANGSFGNGGFFYIMFDDAKVEDEVCGFANVGMSLDFSTNNQTRGVIVHNNMEVDGYSQKNQFSTYVVGANGNRVVSSCLPISSTYYASNIYSTGNYQNQKLQRIKIPTSCVVATDENGNVTSNNTPTQFKVFVVSGLSKLTSTADALDALASNFQNKIEVVDECDKSVFETSQTGFLTIDLKGDGILLEGTHFAVVMQINSGFLFFADNNQEGFFKRTTKSFVSANATSWTEYTSGSKSCILPMMAETTFDFEHILFTAQNTTCTFDGEWHIPDVTTTNPVIATTLFNAGSGWQAEKPMFKDVCEVDVQFKISAPNYVTEIGTVHISILPAPIVIVPLSCTKIYGEADDLPFDIDASFVENGLLLLGDLSREEGEDVGEYAISTNCSLHLASNGSVLASNYQLVFEGDAVLTIEPRTIYLSPVPTTKSYGDVDPQILFEFSNLAGDEVADAVVQMHKVAKNNSINNREDVGMYDVVLDEVVLKVGKNGFKPSNYQVEFVGGEDKFQIAPRELLIVPNANQSKVFGEEDPVFEFSFQNNLQGETPLFAGKLQRADQSNQNAGTYLITLGTLCAKDNGLFKSSNHTLAIAPVEFEILRGEIEGFEVENQQVVYDGNPHSILFDSQSHILVEFCIANSSWQDFDEQNKSLINPTFVNVGTYFVVFKLCSANYRTKFVSAKLQILPKDLIVVPKHNQTKIYGQQDSILFDYFGNLGEQTPRFVGALSRDEGENVGSYLINAGSLMLADNQDFLQSNYNLVFNNTQQVCYQICKKEVTITPLANQSKRYNTADKLILFTYSGTCFDEQIEFENRLIRESGETVGLYKIMLGSLAIKGFQSNNYTPKMCDEAVFFAITPVQLKIQILNKTWLFGNEDFDFEFKFLDNTKKNFDQNDNLGLVFECKDDFGQNVSSDTRKNDNGYLITATAQNPNYNVEILPGKLFITYNVYEISFCVFDKTVKKLFSHFDVIESLPDEIDLNIPGFDFVCWQTSSLQKLATLTNYVVEQNQTFTAVFDTHNYNLNFVLFGGQFLAQPPATFDFWSEFEIDDPTKEGHIFLGFFDNPNFEGEVVDRIWQNTSCDVTLFAKWQAIEYQVFLPTNMSNLNIVVQSNQSISIGNSFCFAVQLDETCNKSYQTMQVFVLWHATGQRERLQGSLQSKQPVDTLQNVRTALASQLQMNFVLSNLPASDFSVEIEGVETNVYQINFVADSRLIKTFNVLHGQSILSSQIPQVPQKEHHTTTPAVWQQTTFENVASDQTVEALYVKDVYTVTMVGEDGKRFEYLVEYGNDVDYSNLQNEYSIGFFDIFVFDKPTTFVEQNQVINFKVQTGPQIVFGIAFVSIVLLVVATSLFSILHRKRNRLKK